MIETFYYKTKYCDSQAYLAISRYQDGSPAIRVISDVGEHLSTATVCVNEPAEEGHVIIKEWSENEGTLKALQNLGVIGPVNKRIKAGYVEAFQCKLLVDPTTDRRFKLL